MKKILFLLPLLSILLFQCSVQKRKYQKGYHVVWNNTHNQSKDQKSTIVAKKTASKAIETPEEIIIHSFSPDESALTASAKKNTTTDEFKVAKTPLIGDEPCDELIFRDGSEMKGKVTEITETEVKYKKCDMLEGPIYVARKTDLFMIKYANGTREVFKNEGPSSSRPTADKKNYPKKTHPLAVASLVMGILSIIPYLFLPAVIMAIVFGNMALRRIAAKPDYYKGEGLATAGKTIAIVMISIYAVLILIFVIAFFLLL